VIIGAKAERRWRAIIATRLRPPVAPRRTFLAIPLQVAMRSRAIIATRLRPQLLSRVIIAAKVERRWHAIIAIRWHAIIATRLLLPVAPRRPLLLLLPVAPRPPLNHPRKPSAFHMIRLATHARRCLLSRPVGMPALLRLLRLLSYAIIATLLQMVAIRPQCAIIATLLPKERSQTMQPVTGKMPAKP
jgi:hypothetical protein